MGIAARTHEFNIDGTKLVITKIMTTEAPRRIAEVVIEMTFPPEAYSDKVKKILEFTVKNCPVALSLHPDVKQTITLHYQ
jgi:uncharacterized OsmC-like protein